MKFKSPLILSLTLIVAFFFSLEAFGQGSTGSTRLMSSYGSNGSAMRAVFGSSYGYGSNGSMIAASYGSNGSAVASASYGSSGSFAAGPLVRFGSAVAANIDARRSARLMARAEAAACRSQYSAFRASYLPVTTQYVMSDDCATCVQQVQWAPMARVPLFQSRCTCVDCQCPNCDCGAAQQKVESQPAPVAPTAPAPVEKAVSDQQPVKTHRPLKKFASQENKLSDLEALLVAVVR